MHAAHTFDFADLLNQIDAQIDAFLFLILSPSQAFDHLVGDMHARHVFANPLGGLGGSKRADAGQYISFFEQAHVAHLCHKGFHALHVEAVLGLNELGACGDLFRHSVWAKIQWRCEGVRSATEE